jgi:hypothetical protein
MLQRYVIPIIVATNIFKLSERQRFIFCYLPYLRSFKSSSQGGGNLKLTANLGYEFKKGT